MVMFYVRTFLQTQSFFSLLSGNGDFSFVNQLYKVQVGIGIEFPCWCALPMNNGGTVGSHRNPI